MDSGEHLASSIYGQRDELTIGSSYIKVGVIAGVSLRVVSALVLVGVCCAGKGRGWQDKGSQIHGFF